LKILLDSEKFSFAFIALFVSSLLCCSIFTLVIMGTVQCGTSTADHILTLNIVSQIRHAYRKSTCAAYVDL